MFDSPVVFDDIQPNIPDSSTEHHGEVYHNIDYNKSNAYPSYIVLDRGIIAVVREEDHENRQCIYDGLIKQLHFVLLPCFEGSDVPNINNSCEVTIHLRQYLDAKVMREEQGKVADQKSPERKQKGKDSEFSMIGVYSFIHFSYHVSHLISLERLVRQTEHKNG